MTPVVLNPANPWLNMGNIVEVFGFVALLVGLLKGIDYFVEKRRRNAHEEAERQRKADQEAHQAIHTALGKEIADLNHAVDSHKQMLNAIEDKNKKDEVRLVKVEMNFESLKEGQARAELAAKENHKEVMESIKEWARQFSESIREIRNVAPKD